MHHQPEQKNQKSCQVFPNIQFHWISYLNTVYHTAKKRSGWCANFVSNISAVIVSRSKIIMLLYFCTNRCNRRLVFSTHIVPGIKKIYCLIFFQLYLSASTCRSRTDISFKKIFKDIFRQLLNCKILSQNILNSYQTLPKFTTNRKQVLSKLTLHYSQHLNLHPLWNPQKVTDSMDALLAASTRLCHWKMKVKMATRGIYRIVPYLVLHWREEKAFPLPVNGIHKISHCRRTLPIKMDFLSTRKYLR